MSTLEPTIGDLITRAIRAQLLDVHTAVPASVLAYYAADHTADVQVGPARAVPTVDGEIAYETLPALPKVPVLAFGTARSFVQIPLQSGDAVWLLFSEASSAEFLDGQDATQPGDLARFSLSSCLAIPFVRPGSALLASPLALLSDVQALLTVLQTTWTPVAGDGGAALKTAMASVAISGTAEIKAK